MILHQERLTPQLFALLLNSARADYLDSSGRHNAHKLYRRLVNLADAVGFRPDRGGWWAVDIEDDFEVVVSVRRK